MQWWLVFWLALSAGLLASLWAGYRGWRFLYPQRDRSRRVVADPVDPEGIQEAREAIAAAEAIVRDARKNSSDR